MKAGMRVLSWMIGTAMVGLTLLVFTGCRSSNSGGCSGGCCRGQNTGSTPTITPLTSGTTAPLPAGNSVTAAEKPYGGQNTCPVTGEDLGSMGPPIPVTVQGQTVYVCCGGCVAKIQRDPEKYLAQVEAERKSK